MDPAKTETKILNPPLKKPDSLFLNEWQIWYDIYSIKSAPNIITNYLINMITGYMYIYMYIFISFHIIHVTYLDKQYPPTMQDEPSTYG